MKPYKEYLKDAGFDFNATCVPPIKLVWYAYNGSTVYGPFDSQSEAKKHSIVVDSVVEEASNQARNNFWAARNAAHAAATKAWKEDLRAEFLIRDAQFDVLYDWAYDRTHSDGHDAIYEKMSTLLDFYSAMLDA